MRAQSINLYLQECVCVRACMRMHVRVCVRERVRVCVCVYVCGS